MATSLNGDADLPFRCGMPVDGPIYVRQRRRRPRLIDASLACDEPTTDGWVVGAMPRHGPALASKTAPCRFLDFTYPVTIYVFHKFAKRWQLAFISISSIASLCRGSRPTQFKRGRSMMADFAGPARIVLSIKAFEMRRLRVCHRRNIPRRSLCGSRRKLAMESLLEAVRRSHRRRQRCNTSSLGRPAGNISVVSSISIVLGAI